MSDILEAFQSPRLYIGGEWIEPRSGATLDVENPTTEQTIGIIADGDSSDVDAAVEAASAARRGWRDRSPSDRADLLLRLERIIEANEHELAALDAIDSGNPKAAMLDDVRGARREIRMFAGLATEIKADSVLNGAEQFSYGVREPFGVVGRIIPFNHPFKFAIGKTAAALVAGNTIVLKPAEQTSLSAIRLTDLVAEILPPGVFNLVTGQGRVAGARIAEHPDVPRVAFTGGVQAGRAVLRAGAEHFKVVTLELGGKNPMIVLPDVDPERAAAAAVSGMNFAKTQGQSCQSNSRVFVHRDIREAFTRAVLDHVAKLRLGDPLEDGVDMGPLAYREHYARVKDYIRRGIEEGAQLLTGDAAVPDSGYFVAPTVFGAVSSDMTIARDEIFGPVLSLIEWDDLDTTIEAANDTSFGLTANIWTNDIRAAHTIAHRIEAGYVWINGQGKRVPGTPFGGFKQSGIGKESSLEEILEYTRHKVVAVSL